jgi:parallel beta-helix repeat protein
VATEEPATVYPQKWATGDGTVENPWANDCIKKAYDFVPDGGTIYLRAGYYQLADQVYITKQINIIGEGMNKTVIKTAGTHGFNIYADYVTLKNLTVDGDDQSDGQAYLCCIGVVDCDYALLENIEVKNAGYYGMNIHQVNHSSFQNIYAHDNYRHGLHPGSDTAGRNKWNTYRDIYAWDNEVNGFDDRGNSVANEESHNVYDNLVCWDNGDYGIAMQMFNGGSLINSSTFNNVTGNYFHTIKDFTIENCSANSNSQRGIYLYNCENVTLSNVITKNNSTSNTDGDPGIHIVNCPSVKLLLCSSYDDVDPLLQDYGIKTTGTTKYVEITNCKLTPNEEGAILNDAGAVITITETKLASF